MTALKQRIAAEALGSFLLFGTAHVAGAPGLVCY